MSVTEDRVDRDTANQVLFASSQLNDTTSHSLTINTSINGAPYSLDFVYILPSMGVLSNNVANTTDSPTPSVSVSSASTTTTQASSADQANQTHVSIIIGGVLGVVILVLLAAVGWLIHVRFLKKRKGTLPGRTSNLSYYSKGNRQGTPFILNNDGDCADSRSRWNDYLHFNRFNPPK